MSRQVSPRACVCLGRLCLFGVHGTRNMNVTYRKSQEEMLKMFFVFFCSLNVILPLRPKGCLSEVFECRGKHEVAG